MSIHRQNLIRGNRTEGNVFCGEHEVIPVSVLNDDGFSQLCLRERGDIYLFFPLIFFFQGVVLLLSTERDAAAFPPTCTFLHSPVQMQVIIKNTPII